MYDNKMNLIPFPDGAQPLDIFISSIDKERVTERLEGMDGKIDFGSTFNERSVELDLLLQSKDTQDYRLLRNAVYSMFQKKDTFYISETRSEERRVGKECRRRRSRKREKEKKGERGARCID